MMCDAEQFELPRFDVNSELRAQSLNNTIMPEFEGKDQHTVATNHLECIKQYSSDWCAIVTVDAIVGQL
jgi:hypothetical protein